MQLQQPPHTALDGLAVLERGWLSSNNVLIHAGAGEAGAVLVDTGHVNHAPQTLALVRHALAGRPLAGIVNTHLHSDHCGGNATLQRAFPGVPLSVAGGQFDAVAGWDDTALSYAATGQRIERFEAQRLLQAGTAVRAGGRSWQVLPAPGHDPHSVILFDADRGVLLSADALWEHGFGVVFPEVQGEPGFDDVAAVLDAIEALPVRVVVPGHGAPFTGVAAALDRARSRLAAFRERPERHARHAAKVLLKYHLMEEGASPRAAVLDWVLATPLLGTVWERQGVGPDPDRGATAAAREWADALVGELVAQGALAAHGDEVRDR